MGDLSDFVSSAILTSEDGLKFTEEVSAGSSASARVSRDAAKLEGRTLFEQLQTNKEKAEEAAQARYKMNFGTSIY